ncbi:MAG: molybdate ABC transporter substrate-binding protein [Candidatus Riflebacteria bacterium]|nr:molybdate ABC transporter substrate-binding protein [Candidatus Riflebacteria bacterium]
MKGRKRTWVQVFLCLIGLSVLPLQAEAKKEILVSSAISLKNVLETVKKSFEEKNSDIRILFNFGASGALANQIMNGAPADLFISADIKDVRKLDENNFLATGTAGSFLENRLVFIVPASSAQDISTLQDLTKAEFKHISIGNPRTTPAGRYAEESLRHFKVYEAVRERLILCENVRQALDYVVQGEVDGGFVYVTDIQTNSKGIRKSMMIPSEAHSPIIYGIGIVKSTKERSSVDKLVDFLCQSESQKIFAEAGFIIPVK